MKLKIITIFLTANMFCAISVAQNIISVDFNQVEKPIPSQMFGVNIFAGMAPQVAEEAVYQQKMEALQLPIVRYHSAQILDEDNQRSWVNFDTQWWDTTRIETALAALDGKVGALMINIYNFPEWLQDPNSGTESKRLLDKGKIDEYADFCAGLVSIVNNEIGIYTKYWEPFNEIEEEFADEGETQFLIDIFNAVTIKMKAVDSSIEIGGPAIQNPYWNTTEQVKWFEGTKSNLDFVSVHAYGTGNSNISNTEIYEKAEGVVSGALHVRNQMNNAGLAADLPLFLDEYNIVWTFTGDSQGKMKSNIGAVFDAIIMKKAVESGEINALMSWNERDGTYGKLSSENSERPAYKVLELANKILKGSTVKSSSYNNNEVMLMATKSAEQRTVMLINRTDNEQVINLDLSNLSVPANAPYQYHFIGNSYYTSTTNLTDQPVKQLVLAPSSVHFIDFDFTATGPAAPTIKIIAPEKNNEDYISPSNVIIKVESEDDGSVERVEFYNGANKLGEDVQAPYEYIWKNVSKGSYNIQIKSIDNEGNINVSLPQKLNISFNGGGDYGNYANFSASTGNAYEAQNFTSESKVYADEELTFAQTPHFFTETVLSQVPTYNSEKANSAESYLNFDSFEDNYLLIAYPVGANSVPNWLASFTNLADTISSSSGQSYVLFSSLEPAGELSLSGAKATGFVGAADLPNYLIFLVADILDMELPSKPENLAFTFGNNGAVKLTWSASTDNIQVDKYQVEQNGQFVRTVTDTTITVIADIDDVINVSAIDVNGNISDAAQITIEEKVLGLSDSNYGLRIFPNPSNGKLSVYSSELVTAFSILDMKGATVLIRKNPKSIGNQYILDIKELPHAIYILRVSGNSGIRVVRFLKN